MGQKEVKRVLQVIFSLSYGGAERLAKDITSGLDRSKFEPMVLGLYGNGPLRADLESCGIKCLNFKRKGRTGLELELYNLLRKEHIDIVHVHGSFLLTRAFIPARTAGAKIVYTEHATYSLERKRRLRYFAGFATSFCHAITTVSYSVKQFLVDTIHVPESKIEVIYNGVDLRNFKLASTKADVPGLPSPSNNNNDLLIGMVARLSEAKDHKTLLEALQLILRKGIQAKLVLVGDGELRTPLEKKTRELGITESVIFLGSRSDIPAILSRLDLCVLSSQREGLPLTLLEYMAMERPFIATRVGAIPEVVRHGENGYLIPPKDPEALAGAISFFYRDPGYWAKLAAEGRKTVEKFYDIDVVTRAYQEIYEKILSK